jgi:hypothetical protein
LQAERQVAVGEERFHAEIGHGALAFIRRLFTASLAMRRAG